MFVFSLTLPLIIFFILELLLFYHTHCFYEKTHVCSPDNAELMREVKKERSIV